MILARHIARAAIACSLLALAAGCTSKKDATKSNLESAINTYYSAHPECLWTASVKFPTQTGTSDTGKTQGYDALTDQGLLTRIQDTKKVFIFGSKQVSDFDLSSKGHAAWTADPQQPGFGNFCYGHRDVTSIDSFTPTNNTPGSTTTVDYHYQLSNVASWANNAEVKTAFPNVATALAGTQADKATLALTDNGWQVSKTD